MEYTIAVPVISNRIEWQGREKLLDEMKKLGAKRVFLALSRYITNEKKFKKTLETLKDNCEFFHAQGFEVGVWTWAFWTEEKNPYVKITSKEGKESDFCCPLDPEFRAFACAYVTELVKCGVDIVMFDDDFRYQHLANGANCFCDLHLARVNEILGEKLSLPELLEKAFTGGKNEYREAWLQSLGEGLKLFAKDVRTAVDKVDPSVRIGACSCISSWSTDGVNPYEVAKIFAGKTKPFIRGIGAPYWAVLKNWGNRLEDIIELERFEVSMNDGTVEFFAEGDVNPRPRTACPSSYLELFNLALIADGKQNGILKYALDYESSADYEKGYVLRHERNAKAYEFVKKNMSSFPALGVRIYENMQKIHTTVFASPDELYNVCDLSTFSPAYKICSELSIPTTYDGYGIGGVAFAENVDVVPEKAFENGIVTDIIGAQILQSRGVDCGLFSVGDDFYAETEYFADYAENVKARYKVSKVEISKNAVVSSKYVSENHDGSTNETIGSYYYENANGQKFLVFVARAYYCDNYFIRSYCRSRQLKDFFEKASGKRLPAYCYGNPDLYVMCKGDENVKTVGLFNVFEDDVIAPVLNLDGKYKVVETINCTAQADGENVILSDMAAYSFAALKIEKVK